jgi:type I restriction-modification system DNA methylase subunit
MAKLPLAKLERHLYAEVDILRREGMDAATHKDFIFGIMFLKRSLDVFEAARVNADPKPADNSDYFYDDFFVPEEARWTTLLPSLNDADFVYGCVLDKALVGLSEKNEAVQHVFDHILAPAPGLSIDDPTCGSGGRLIITREHIERTGADPTNLRRCGQVSSASAWSIGKLNMLLDGERGADNQLQDTLLHPMQRGAASRLPPNRPYGAGIPACLLEMRPYLPETINPGGPA